MCIICIPQNGAVRKERIMNTALKSNTKTAQEKLEAIENINLNEYEQDNVVSRIIDNVHVNVSSKFGSAYSNPISDKEIRAYIQRGNLKNPYTVVKGLDLVLDGEDVEISYDLAPIPFDRIRRITGYLVGTMDRWNNAKTSEEQDRVKHAVVA